MRLRSAEIVAIARHSLWYIKLKMYISSLKTAGRNTTKNEQQQERMRKEEEGETKTKTETNIKCWKWKLVLQVSPAPNDTIRTDPIRSDPIRIRSLRWDANAWFSRILSTFLFRVRMINNKSNAKMSVMYVACQRLRLFMAWINKNNAPIRDDKLTTKTKNNFENEKKKKFLSTAENVSHTRWVSLPPSPSLSLPSHTQLVAFEIGIGIENVWKRFRKCRWRRRVSQTNDYECDASCRPMSLMTAPITPLMGEGNTECWCWDSFMEIDRKLGYTLNGKIISFWAGFWKYLEQII